MIKMNQSNTAGIILCLMGIVLCFFSPVIWKISEKWKSDNASAPSAKYTAVLRILGVIFTVFGILLFSGVIK